ncbi:hypothetical protein P7C70_g3759, partial [Phenoliferia sp. Uapishka_3]
MRYIIPDPTSSTWAGLGGNPFTNYLVALDRYAYSTPSEGLKARIIILMIILGLVAVVTFSVLTIAGSLLALINLGSLVLLFSVRRQISFKITELAGHLWTRAVENDDADDWAIDSSPFEDTNFVSGQTSKYGPPTIDICLAESAGPTRSEIRKMAKLEAGGPRGESAKQIAALQRAERDLLILAWTIAQLAIGGTIIVLAISVLLGRKTYFNSSWPLLEVAYFLATWSFSITILGWAICTIHNTYINLPPPRSSLPPSSMRSKATSSRTKTPRRSPWASQISVEREEAVRIELGPPPLGKVSNEMEELGTTDMGFMEALGEE